MKEAIFGPGPEVRHGLLICKSGIFQASTAARSPESTRRGGTYRCAQSHAHSVGSGGTTRLFAKTLNEPHSAEVVKEALVEGKTD